MAAKPDPPSPAASQQRRTYLRFVITQLDGDSRQPQGLFIAADVLLKSGDLNAEDHCNLQEIVTWFNLNLPVPATPTIRGRVIFWFRPDAQKFIHKMWTLVHALSEHGHLVEVQKCEFLSNIVYHDDFQVAAYPHKRDGLRTFK